MTERAVVAGMSPAISCSGVAMRRSIGTRGLTASEISPNASHSEAATATIAVYTSYVLRAPLPRAAVPLGLCFFAAVPPPRSKFVPLGFLPDDRRSPARLPAPTGDFVVLMFFDFEIEAIKSSFVLRSSGKRQGVQAA